MYTAIGHGCNITSVDYLRHIRVTHTRVSGHTTVENGCLSLLYGVLRRTIETTRVG